VKLSAQFKDGFLSLLCEPETEAEQFMIGAVINQPTENGEIHPSLLMAEIKTEVHWTHKKVKSLRLTVAREQP